MKKIVLGAIWLGVLLTGCGGGAKPSAQEQAAAPDAGGDKIVNVYNWSDYIDPTVLEEFTRKTGIKVNYDVFDSNQVLETKMLTGHTNYDIVVPSAPFLQRQISAGVFQKLDKSKLPNLKNLDPDMMKRIAVYDPDNEHSVPYMWVTSGPGYNVAKIKERLPDAPVDSLRMIYDPKVVSKFQDCGVSMLDEASEVVGSVLIYLGKNPRSNSPEDLQAAENTLLAIRPFLRYIHSSRYIDDLANGET